MIVIFKAISELKQIMNTCETKEGVILLRKEMRAIKNEKYQGPALTDLNETELKNLREWNFNVLFVPELTNKYRFTFGMFTDTNLFDLLKVDTQQFASFLQMLRNKYEHRHNPFHNFNHGITVTHGIYQIIRIGLTSSVLDEIETFALLFSALCHDVDHTGHSNMYETNSNSPLFQTYGSQSPLEYHHIAVSFRLIELNKLFKNLSEEQIKTIKKFMTNNILATDMSKHNEIMNGFKAIIPRFLTDKPMTLDQATEQDKLSVSGALVHAADIGAPTRDFSISREWSILISKEFVGQLKLEEEKKIPLTTFYQGLDKYIQVAKNEVGFINFFIKPFWMDIVTFANGKLPQVEPNINRNIQLWKDELQKEVEKQQTTQP